MSFRHQDSKSFLAQINREVGLHFEDMTCDIDLFDIAVAEYNGVILQLIFPDHANGYHHFNFMRTDITKAETTIFFPNESGSLNLTLEEAVLLINQYIADENKRFQAPRKQRGIRG